MSRLLHKNFNTFKTTALAIADSRLIFGLVILALIFSFVSYTFLLQRTVKNVAFRQGFEKEMSVLTSEIGELEFKYISMRNNITIDVAYALGFNDAATTKFITRKSLSSAARLGTVQ